MHFRYGTFGILVDELPKHQTMMKHTIITKTCIILLLSLYESVIQEVSADIMVQFVFNNGESPNDTVYCSKSDNEKIDKIFQWKSINHRHLRRATTDDYHTTNTNEAMTRELRTYPRSCKNYCAYYATGTCRATNCLGYGGRSLGKIGKSDTSGGNQAEKCKEGLTITQMKLNELISKNSVSNSCKLFLQNTTRTSTCYDDVVYGEVEGYRIWNLTSTNSNSTSTINSNGNAYGQRSSSLLFESYTMNTGSGSSGGGGGYAFCRTTVFNIEVMTNECVDHAHITIRGPNQYHIDRTESYIPFTIFSSTTTDSLNINQKKQILMGQTVPYIGTYNVTIVPDGIATKMKQFDFSILDC